MRILVVKLSSIGDIVHTLPAIAAIRKELPDSQLFWVAERTSAEVLGNNPLLDGLIEIDTKALRGGKAVLGKTLESAFRQFRKLRSSELDLSLDFQGLFKSATIAKLSGASRRFGFSKDSLREPGSRVLLTDTIRVDPDNNVVFKNFDLAEGALREYLAKPDLTLDRTEITFPIATNGADKASADEVAARAGGPFVILNPGGGWVTKLWRAEDFGALADKIRDELGLTPVLSVGPGDQALAKRVTEATSAGKIVHAELGIKGFFELAKRAEAYVGGDTGPTHLAVAAGCPVVGIFGPTEWWRNGSVNDLDIEVGRKGLECRVDCHRRTCDKWICMDIPVQTVFDAVSKRLRTGRIPASQPAGSVTGAPK